MSFLLFVVVEGKNTNFATWEIYDITQLVLAKSTHLRTKPIRFFSFFPKHLMLWKFTSMRILSVVYCFGGILCLFSCLKFISNLYFSLKWYKLIYFSIFHFSQKKKSKSSILWLLVCGVATCSHRCRIVIFGHVY